MRTAWNKGKKLHYQIWNKGKKLDGYDYRNSGTSTNSIAARFQKGHAFVVGGEKGWFKKGQKSWNSGKKGLQIAWNKGKPFLQIRGEKHWAWDIEKSHRHELRNRIEYKLWRKAVFERDNYTCTSCTRRGGNLQADHIKSFAHYPKLRLVLKNGRTLCENCHKNTDNYLWKAIKKLPNNQESSVLN